MSRRVSINTYTFKRSAVRTEHVVNRYQCTAETRTSGLARRRRIRDGECDRNYRRARLEYYTACTSFAIKVASEGLPLRTLGKSMDMPKEVAAIPIAARYSFQRYRSNLPSVKSNDSITPPQSAIFFNAILAPTRIAIHAINKQRAVSLFLQIIQRAS